LRIVVGYAVTNTGIGWEGKAYSSPRDDEQGRVEPALNETTVAKGDVET
jgi:hypothetical protein